MNNPVTEQPASLTTAKFSPKVMVSGHGCLAAELSDIPFLIPIYQRLYSWETEHVQGLLDDLWDAFRYGVPLNQQKEYFIGALVVTRETVEGQVLLELIDGQQRLTTLWLLASVLVTKSELELERRSQWQQFIALAQQSRLVFSGREADIKSFNTFIQNVGQDKEGRYSANNQQWLSNTAMINARTVIANFFSARANDWNHDRLQAFSDYIWAKATFVITQLDTHTDKERFFDTMNSRGIQLEKHEILKALMLTGLNDDERVAYARVWDLCADIHGYLPSELQTAVNFGFAPLHNMEKNDLFSACKIVEVADNRDALTGDLSLEAILAPEFSLSVVVDTQQSAPPAVKSPVSFPVFLLHVLSIFLKENSDLPVKQKTVSLDGKKLIETFKPVFENSDKSLRVAFIECLLKCRLLLDNFIIKGHTDTANAYADWKISSRLADPCRKSPAKFTGEVWKSIQMLQSMMHFSPMNGGQRTTWLSPVLSALIAQQNAPGTDAFAQSFLATLQLHDKAYANSILNGQSLSSALGASEGNALGTQVHHYWFYKLEYCLWQLWYNSSAGDKSTLCPKPDNLSAPQLTFRMRSVNSVEHISPQSQNNGEVDAAMLDRFGNLALISISENSTYSDADPLTKRGIFVSHLKKGLIQSLKLAHIFSTFETDSSDWTNEAMAQHEQKMLDVLTAFHDEGSAFNNSTL
ncbi:MULTISPECIES: DUF262 domain-containing protein [unclassified Oceanobacter]|uniref:DUF262 domain-containing protein n=1 Tax=unclassified Oceanobacter TaxID=2620260 RepID=UPI0027325840|nr:MULTISPECIES: DUF262 domain-containing protein [unclassified Oceanobacter]MDP2607438.1 DUF262 domain-containing protein [Oceanobacter sp. 1_MG-2023]MDP2610706.1 DUF262 domain-containing protein [Oceanobacter sp. 2_MG-2023]